MALMAAFATEQKRAIAMRLIASGKWDAHRWSSVSEIVHNECLGLLPDGTLVVRPRPERPVKPLMSLDEAAATAGVHSITIRRWIKAGKLNVVPDDKGMPSLRRKELQQFLETRGGR